MPATTKRKKNPVAPASELKPFPFMRADFPVKPWINAQTAVEFMTVSFRQDDGTFAAFIAEDESVWAVGKTRREAEDAVKALYTAERNSAKIAEQKELVEDIRIALSRADEPSIPWEDVKRKHGF